MKEINPYAQCVVLSALIAAWAFIVIDPSRTEALLTLFTLSIMTEILLLCLMLVLIPALPVILLYLSARMFQAIKHHHYSCRMLYRTIATLGMIPFVIGFVQLTRLILK